jgi:uncharacterized protein
MKYALVTGGSKGIGKAIAEELASRKINIIVVARSEELLEQVAEEIAKKYKVSTQYFAIDLSEKGAAEKVNSWCNSNNFSINILVNNAGYGLSGALEKYTIAQYTAMMQVNMNVLVEMSYLFIDMLKNNTNSYILNIASAAAYQSVPGLNVYAATKSFVLSFSRGLNFELKDTNVFVTVGCPGATDTNFANRANATGKKAVEMAKKFNMQPQEVAKIIVDGMFNKKIEIVTGLTNKLGVFFAWLLPKKIVEKLAGSIYDL